MQVFGRENFTLRNPLGRKIEPQQATQEPTAQQPSQTIAGSTSSNTINLNIDNLFEDGRKQTTGSSDLNLISDTTDDNPKVDSQGLFKGSVEELIALSPQAQAQIKILDIGSELTQLSKALENGDAIVPQNLTEFKFTLSNKGSSNETITTAQRKDALDAIAYHVSTDLGRSGRSGESVKFTADFHDIVYSAEFAKENPSIIGTQDAANTFCELCNSHPNTRTQQNDIVSTIISTATNNVASANGSHEIDSHIPGSTNSTQGNGKSPYQAVIGRLIQGQAPATREAAQVLIASIKEKLGENSTATTNSTIDADGADDHATGNLEQLSPTLNLGAQDLTAGNIQERVIDLNTNDLAAFGDNQVQSETFDPANLAAAPDVEVNTTYSVDDLLSSDATEPETVANLGAQEETTVAVREEALAQPLVSPETSLAQQNFVAALAAPAQRLASQIASQANPATRRPEANIKEGTSESGILQMAETIINGQGKRDIDLDSLLEEYTTGPNRDDAKTNLYRSLNEADIDTEGLNFTVTNSSENFPMMRGLAQTFIAAGLGDVNIDLTAKNGQVTYTTANELAAPKEETTPEAQAAEKKNLV